MAMSSAVNPSTTTALSSPPAKYARIPAPSANRILEIFGPLQRHLLCNADRVVQRFDPELIGFQRTLLAFLGISPKVFMNV